MARFKVVSIQHEYPSTEHERRIVTGAGGEYVDADGLPLEEALRHCEDADAILVRWLKMGPDLIQRFRRCKIIIRYGVGYDNVDLAAATEAGIMVGHSPSYCVDEVATHARLHGRTARFDCQSRSAAPPGPVRRMDAELRGALADEAARTAARQQAC